MQTTSVEQAQAWALELFSEPNVAQFWIPRRNFVQAVRTQDSISFTRTDEGLYGLAIGPHPIIPAQWNRFSVFKTVPKALTETCTLTGQWAAYARTTEPGTNSPDIRQLADEVWIKGFLETHAPESSVLPGNPEIREWVGIAHEDEVVAIAAITEWESGECMISSVGTAAPFRGQGFAKKLMNAVIHRAFNLGYSRLGLAVMSKNLPARAVYEAVGFVEMGDFRYFERD